MNKAPITLLEAACREEDDDLNSAPRAMAILGPAVRHWRDAQARALKAVSAAVRPLERKLRAAMPPHMVLAPT